MDRACRELRAELARLSAPDAVISTNVELRQDGLPYRSRPEPAEPGVAVQWTEVGGQMVVVACDRWSTVRGNLRAVGLAVTALRLVERTRDRQLVDRALRGFIEQRSSSWQVLGIEPTQSLSELRRSYRRLALQRHPDRGGTAVQFHQLTEAYQRLSEQLREAG